jgi:PAS domain-containing protein
MPDDSQDEFFSSDWLISESVRTLIDSAPTGVALLRAVRDVTGQITDFQYQLVNPIHQALTNYPEEDLMSLPLTKLYPNMAGRQMLMQLIHVVTSGKPSLQLETYQLDGDVILYDQLYLKSGDGVLLLVQDVTYWPLSPCEHQQQADLLKAIQQKKSVDSVRERLLRLISGQTR